ncbi:hypothetical protein FA13DRAFT_775290 [Coprinellus micaceus]|uniref:Uncharacterized protein n=1 Tax=Coprinellus micaceus TaxID=71717 RepID=A0A4Y7T3Y2_COPMI|nr:hypothetical protein FA13DRAFT_775290 [Coprinellus micaceus]
MSGISAAQIQALADAVEWSRISEDIYIAFYCLYVYYFLTTLAEDVSIILPQKWNRGKIIYVLVRFGTLAFITLQLLRDYRSYFLFSPGACKALYFMTATSLYTVVLTCNLSLGLCLGALLRAKTLYLAAIVILSCGIPFVSAVIGLVSVIQYPAEPVPFPFDELGYSCYIPSPAQTASQTILSVGRDIRAYVNLVTTALLMLVGAVTLIVRYKGSGGHLIQVIRRDGGVHYLSLLAIRMAAAIIRTPAVVPASESDGNSAYPSAPTHQHAQSRLYGFRARCFKAPLRSSDSWIGR